MGYLQQTKTFSWDTSKNYQSGKSHAMFAFKELLRQII